VRRLCLVAVTALWRGALDQPDNTVIRYAKALQAVVDAIRDGEPEKAYKACVAHVTEASSLAEQYLMSTAATDAMPTTRQARRQARASG
jgi:DNA-binding FadR family transcriptional regulator